MLKMSEHNSQEHRTLFQYKQGVQLDKKDIKILYELYKNARVPISVIAKKAALSKDTIKYRIQRMEKSGLILGYTAIINLNRLGYKWTMIVIQATFQNQHKEAEFLQFLQSSENIVRVMKCSGSWDYQCDVIFREQHELTQTIRKIKELAVLLNFKVLTSLREVKYAHIPQAFFRDIIHEPAQAPVGRIDETQEKVALDSTDFSLLKLLAQNSRTSLLELSNKIQLSPDATKKRTEKLQKNNVLRGYMPVINTALLYDEHWIFMQTSGASDILSYLKQHPHVQAIYEVGYNYDIFFWLSTKSVGEYEMLLSDIKTKFAGTITKMDSVVALREHKYMELSNVEITPACP